VFFQGVERKIGEQGKERKLSELKITQEMASSSADGRSQKRMTSARLSSLQDTRIKREVRSRDLNEK